MPPHLESVQVLHQLPLRHLYNEPYCHIPPSEVQVPYWSEHAGLAQTHLPEEHDKGEVHEPQLPPHPLSPQTLVVPSGFVQLGVHDAQFTPSDAQPYVHVS